MNTDEFMGEAREFIDKSMEKINQKLEHVAAPVLINILIDDGKVEKV